MKSYSKNNFFHQGFTILELVVVLGIMGFLIAFSVIQFKGFTRTRTLDALADRTAFSIRRVQVRTLAGERTNGSRPPGGYGVVFTSCTALCSYTVFADAHPGANPNHIYDPDMGSGPFDPIVTQELLPPTVQISVNPSPVATMVFAPPQGIAFVNGGTTVDQVTIRIQQTSGSDHRDILVDRRSGLVTVVTN